MRLSHHKSARVPRPSGHGQDGPATPSEKTPACLPAVGGWRFEGPTDDAETNELPERQKRNLLATMIPSHGTPMLLAGDEFGHSQNGNNNAYAQDNEITRLNWLGIDARGRSLREFTRKLIATRGLITPIMTWWISRCRRCRKGGTGKA
jgi:pullulanase/glycogen debranching enzyme